LGGYDRATSNTPVMTGSSKALMYRGRVGGEKNCNDL